MLALYTGCRLSEIERLAWEDVDQINGRVIVRGTKTRGSRRWIAMPAPLLDVLATVPDRDRTGPIAGRWANVRRDLHDACKRAGIEPVSPNDLRRTYASWLKQRGVASAAVAKLLGPRRREWSTWSTATCPTTHWPPQSPSCPRLAVAY